MIKEVEVKFLKSLAKLVVVMLNEFMDCGLLLLDFEQLLFEEGLHEEGLRVEADYFEVVFDHFDGAFMAEKLPSVLF